MATRCTKTTNLEIHHISRTGGNSVSNAQVLCQKCHENTHSYGTPGTSPPEFDEETKKQALKNAGNQCQCVRDSCH